MDTATAPATDWPDGLLDLDDLLSAGQATRQVRRWNGKKTHPTTIWRWMVEGKHGVCLPHVTIGRDRFTTEMALRWFFEEVTRVTCRQFSPARPSSPEVDVPADISAKLESEGL